MFRGLRLFLPVSRAVQRYCVPALNTPSTVYLSGLPRRLSAYCSMSSLSGALDEPALKRVRTEEPRKVQIFWHDNCLGRMDPDNLHVVNWNA